MERRPAERFVVGSVTGWPVKANSARRTGYRHPATIWYVHDSAYCYRVVAEFRPRGGRAKLTHRELAEQLAARLNAEHGAGSGDTAPMPLLDSLYRRLSAGDRAA